MKFLLSAVLLIGAMNANAETVTLNLKKAGRYIITLSTPEGCSPAVYTIVPTETGWSKTNSTLMKANVSEVVETRGRATVCRDGFNVATGIVNVAEQTVLEIDLAGANSNLDSPVVKLEDVTPKKTK